MRIAPDASSPRQTEQLPDEYIDSLRDDDDDEGRDDPLTSQSGKGLLRRAMNYAEHHEHNAAFDCLTQAKKARAPRGLVKKTEDYLDSLRN